jgi:curved DNA-binding protein CbpA
VSAVPHETHYEALGITRRATSEQIEKAHEFLKQMYDDVALATYTLLDAEEMRIARARVNQAYEILGDPNRRRDYDVSLDAASREKAVLPFAAVGASPRHEVAPTTAVLPNPVTGENLRRLREEQGVALRDISAASKIGVRFFEYIEADRHSHLPARVYLRSFLQEYAKALGLDPRQTAEAYIARLPKTER